jgi:hypothetical protein
MAQDIHWTRSIRHALENNEFVLHYQPLLHQVADDFPLRSVAETEDQSRAHRTSDISSSGLAVWINKSIAGLSSMHQALLGIYSRGLRLNSLPTWRFVRG